ncbi:FHA domain-containing protein [Streptomyces sp. NBC_01551]|uniref:FHA domain-containing protein n=1 Tax=Streptomyces sp. NBC_01551 TaxID=2975876 RepID=UPI00224DA60E|nr:FHA domain-containing protein [Streptomyces sp. NBC_01551]MCX4525915.1 FHA domain-containing protein [Streptomyces sp. NBC_01551]
MPTCPNGHHSGSDDWCEVCGHRMAASSPAPAATGAPAAPSYGYGFPPTAGEPTAQAELCPQCRTPREAMAPFCEECRYNFLTRTATSYTPLAPEPGMGTGGGPGAGAGIAPPPPPPAPPVAPPAPPAPPVPPAYSQDHFEYQGSRPSRVNRPAEPLQREDDWLLPPPAHEQHQQPHYQQQPPPPPAQQEYQQPEYQQPAQHQEYAPAQQQPAYERPEYEQPEYEQPRRQHESFPSQGGGSWSATIGPDRSYFMAMMQRSGPDAAGLNLPAYSPELRLPLAGGQITIGRRRASTGESPDVDLSVPPEDPGVSHQHAVLVQQPDGSWAVVDQNSTNGTTINGGEEPIQPYVPVPLTDGDRVHVGAWTTITIRRG